MPLTTNNTTDNKCLMGLLCSRRRTSKQLLKLTKDICDLKQQGSFPDIAHQPPPPDGVYIDQTGTVENIQSRKHIMKEVMEALIDDDIRSIGVYGMGGIGKTTLVTSINNELLKTPSSMKVILVTVSKDPNLKIIQDKIAEMLDLKLETQDITRRADKLRERLKSEESVLIILDDVWEVMKLGEIGLQHSSERIPCKLIVTTRNADVCRGMDVKKVIKMDILPEEEAWSLFEAKVGNVVEMPRLERIARGIVSRCNGSPLAIATLGSTLRAEKEERIWAHALQVLQEPNAMGLEGIMTEVVTSLKWSYDHLKKKPNVQLCFLYCCLFPEDYDIRLTDLRNYGIGEGFLNMTSTLEDALNELLFYVKILKDCCLLLDGDRVGSVKMHDVVRDVAICIASNDEDGFLVNVGGGSKYLPESDKLQTYKRFSYMKNNRDSAFPNALECPQLRSLLVRDNYSENISFEGVKSLRVLEWNYVSVSESISQLRNLRTLYLDGCDLFDETYVLGGLMKLEVLSMRWSNIGEVSEEFGNLINLKLLDLTGAEIEFVAPNIFSRFLKMEELLIADSIKGWDTTGELEDDHGYRRWSIKEDGSRRNAELKEVLSLPRLSLLDILIDRPLLDGEVLNYHNLQNFRIIFNYDEGMEKDFGCDMNTLHIVKTDLGKNVIGNLLAVSNKNLDLYLWDCGGFKSVRDLYPAGSFNHLKSLDLGQCNDVESVIVADTSTITAQDSFGKLERLQLCGLDKMERILHGATSSPKFLGKLKTLFVSGCPKIGTIFPCNLLFTDKRLENLSTLNVHGCDGVQYIFNTEDNEFGATPATTALLSGVTIISLSKLPTLKSIWKGIMPEGSFQGLTHLYVKKCPSLKYLLPSHVAGLLQNLEEIEIQDCDEVQHIFSTEDNEFGATPATTALLCGITHIKLSCLPKLKRIWKGIMPEGSFQGLTRLSVDSCPKLKSIFSFCVARHLHKLNKLFISHCHGLRQVLGNGDDPRVAEHRCLLPELKYLEFADLMSLTRFEQDNLPISCPLQEIKVFVYPNLIRLPIQTVSALNFIQAEDIWFKILEDEGQTSILEPFFQAIPVPSSYKINEKLHSLLWKVSRLWLDEYDSQLEGITQFRRLLSEGYLDDMDLWDVEKSGVVPCLVEFMTREDHTQLQSEAAWVLVDIASRSSDHTELVINYGALPIFLTLLCSPNEFIRVQAIWALDKIARDSPEHRDLVLRHIAYLQGHDNSEIQQEAADILNSLQLDKYTPSTGDATVASFQSGGSKSNDVEKETISSKHTQFKVGPGANSNRPLLRPKPTNKNVSKTGLVKKEKRVIVHKDYGMSRADDPLCMTSLGDAKIDLKYPPSSSIELAKEHNADQIPNEEPYIRDITSNAFVKTDDSSSQSSSTELAKRSHVIHIPEQELHYKETWRNIFMKLNHNSLPSTSTKLENES